MRHPIQQLQSHSFRLLLYLEWILLGIATLFQFQPEPLPPPHQVECQLHHPHQFNLQLEPQFPVMTILSIVIFGVIGLRLPRTQPIYKVLYTGLEFGIIFLPLVLQKPYQWIGSFPFLCLIMVIRSCQIFQPSGRIIVAGLAFISFLLGLLYTSPTHRVSESLEEPFMKFMKNHEWTLKWNAALLFGLTLVFFLLLINALLAERQSRQKLAIAHEQLRRYAQMIEDQATLQERNRIAREIHDSLGHSLTAQSIQLENALMFCQSNTQKTQGFLLEAKQLGSNALREVRQSISTLRSHPLSGQSLESELVSLTKDFQRTTGIMPECKFNLSLQLSSEVSTATYRIVKEALNNVYKHSAATQVTINVQTKAEMLSLFIEDNGVGFKIDQNTTGFGLQGMRERAIALGGRFNIETEPGRGCQILVYLPLSMISS